MQRRCACLQVTQANSKRLAAKQRQTPAASNGPQPQNQPTNPPSARLLARGARIQYSSCAVKLTCSLSNFWLSMQKREESMNTCLSLSTGNSYFHQLPLNTILSPKYKSFIDLGFSKSHKIDQEKSMCEQRKLPHVLKVCITKKKKKKSLDTVSGLACVASPSQMMQKCKHEANLHASEQSLPQKCLPVF